MNKKSMSDKYNSFCKKFLTLAKKNKYYSFLLILSLIILFLFYYYSNQPKFTIIKSHWPAWDYFEQLHTPPYKKSGVAPKFVTKNNYEEAFNFILNANIYNIEISGNHFHSNNDELIKLINNYVSTLINCYRLEALAISSKFTLL